MNTITRSHSARGHTLIELMIAIAIGLAMTLVAFKVMATFEGHKRTSTALNDALQSANFGLYQLDKLTRSAGTGIVQLANYAWGCPLNYTATGGPTISDGAVTLPTPFTGVLSGTGVSLRLAPAVIFPNAIGASSSDALMVMSGGSGFGETPVQFSTAAIGNQLKLTNTIGFFPSDWVIVSANASKPATVSRCMITQVGSAYAAETASNSTGNVTLPLTQNAVGAATLATFNVNAYVADLGKGTNASFMLYGVDTTDYSLKSVDLLNSSLAAAQKVGDDVVTLRAVYGINTTGAGALTWVNPVDSGANLYSPASLLDGTDAARTRLRSIRAVRVAVIVRSPLNERTDAADKALGTGEQVNAGSVTMFSSVGLTQTYSIPSALSGYRFRELEATIPIRNSYY